MSGFYLENEPYTSLVSAMGWEITTGVCLWMLSQQICSIVQKSVIMGRLPSSIVNRVEKPPLHQWKTCRSTCRKRTRCNSLTMWNVRLVSPTHKKATSSVSRSETKGCCAARLAEYIMFSDQRLCSSVNEACGTVSKICCWTSSVL